MGDNVSNRVQTDQLAQSQEGVAQITETLFTQVEAGEIKDEKTLKILEKYRASLEAQYAAQGGATQEYVA